MDLNPKNQRESRNLVLLRPAFRSGEPASAGWRGQSHEFGLSQSGTKKQRGNPIWQEKPAGRGSTGGRTVMRGSRSEDCRQLKKSRSMRSFTPCHRMPSASGGGMSGQRETRLWRKYGRVFLWVKMRRPSGRGTGFIRLY
mgnify:CR=1 FL=1